MTKFGGLTVTSPYSPKAKGGNTISRCNEDGKKTSPKDADMIFASLPSEFFTMQSQQKDGSKDFTATWLED